MNKKIGKSILIGIVICTMIISLIGIIYTSFANTSYAAESNDFYFCKRNTNDKISSFNVEVGKLDASDSDRDSVRATCGLKLPENTTIYDIDAYINGKKLLKEADEIYFATSSSNVSFSGENYDFQLSVSDSGKILVVIVGKKIGANEKIVLKISKNGKEYETSLNVSTKDSDFRFALDGRRIKEYTGRYAFEVGGEYDFNMKLPSGYTMDDVKFASFNDNGCIEIIQNNKIIAKKAGSGRILAALTNKDGAKVYSYTNFEVVDKKSEEFEGSGKTETETKDEDKYVLPKSINFNEKKRIVTLSSNSSIVTIYETPSVTGMKKGSIEFSVSDTSVADVSRETNSNKAIITIKKPGKFILKAIYSSDSSISAEKEIIVHSNTLNIFEKNKNTKLNNEDISLNVGETFDLSAYEEDENLDSSLLKYTSTSEKICTVDENGKITAHAKGSATIKVALAESTRTYAKVYVKVSANKEEQMLSQTFSFPKDENGKVIQAKGENALIVGKTYTYDLIRPTGTENYEVTYECNKKGLLEIIGEKITPLKAGKGTLTAKIKIGTKEKTASINIEVFANETEKNEEKAETTKYLNIEFANNSMVIEKGNVSTLKPTITTNMKKSEYKLNWSSSNDNIVQVDKNGRLTTSGIGTATVTVEASHDKSINATIDIEVKEKVVLVKALKFNTNLDKNGSNYILRVNEPVTIDFEVSPENATLKDYSIEVDDKENFLVQGKTVIALKEGVKTKLTARSLDSGNRTVTISLESIISSEELSGLQQITDNSEITLQVGETLKFKKPSKTIVSKSSSAISCKTTSDDVITITGERKGTGEIRIKSNNNLVATIPVNVVAKNATKEDVSVKSIELPIDEKTAQPKNYTTDYPLVVDKCYNIVDAVSVYPANATNKDINVEVSDKSAFTVTSEGNIIANKADANAVVTLSSVSNPEIVTAFNISSTSAAIKSIKFAKNYIGEYKLTLANVWNFNLIITLDNGETLDPTTMSDPDNNQEYQKYLKQIVIESSDTSLLEFDNTMTAKVVTGKNGNGTLNAYVKSTPNIKTTAKFETVGINEDTQIKKAQFVKSIYDVDLNDSDTEFCPIITLSNGHVFDPSKDYGSENSVANSDDYRNYIEQLELEVVDTGAAKKMLKINNNSRKLSINPQLEGTCEIVLKLKSTGEELSRARLVIANRESSSNSTLTGVVTEINHATTTSNRNLRITNIQFVDRSYEVNNNYIVHFQPIITLSDGTEMTHESADNDTYLYYLNQTELYFVNETSNASIDFGIAELVNTEVPRAIIPLKNGKIRLAVGLKSSTSQTTYDEVPVTIKIN